MKSCLDETMSRRLSIALERFEIQVVALSMATISSTVSLRIGIVIDPVASLNAANMIWNLAKWVYACKVAGQCN